MRRAFEALEIMAWRIRKKKPNISPMSLGITGVTFYKIVMYIAEHEMRRRWARLGAKAQTI